MCIEITEELIEISSPLGRLEGKLAYPSDKMPDSLVLLLSPHPHLGGNMENNVIRYLGQGCARLGYATLRFNYHGVGNSTMNDPPPISAREYWSEIERKREYSRLHPDVSAAWDCIRACNPEANNTVVVGYSLGAVLAGLCCETFPNATVIAIAPPVDRVTLAGFESCKTHKVFITGDRDFTYDESAFNRYFRSLPEPRHHIRFSEEDHFFRKSEEDLLQKMLPFLLPRGDMQCVGS